MKNNFDKCLKMLLHHEGGFTDDVRDLGNNGDGHGNRGSTNLGVTAKVWAEWTKKPAPIEVMKALTADDIGVMYRKKYWDRVQSDYLSDGLDWTCFDWCVNSGKSRPSKALQRIIGATADGSIGPATLTLVADHDPVELIEKMFDLRQSFYEGLSTFDTFGRGWTRRNKETLEQSLKMAGE